MLYAALGAGLMGIWSSTLFGSGGAIQWQRWQGTLELLVAAPAPFVLGAAADHARDRVDRPLLDRRDAGLGPGLSSACRSSSCTRPLFALALPATRHQPRACSASCSRRPFVLYRHANAFSNLLEYPVWLVTGLLVPVSLLPGWAEPTLLGARADLGRARRSANAALGGEVVARDRDVRPASARSTSCLGAVFMHNFERLRPPARDPLADMSAALRVVLRRRADLATARSSTGSRPGIYIPTMLGSPLFQILFFTYLGRFAGGADDDFFVVGNAVQVGVDGGHLRRWRWRSRTSGSSARSRRCSRTPANRLARLLRPQRCRCIVERPLRLGVRLRGRLAAARLRARRRQRSPRARARRRRHASSRARRSGC